MGSAVAAVCCCRCAWLTLNRQQHSEAGMSDTGLTVPAMTEPPRLYDVTITVDSVFCGPRDGTLRVIRSELGRLLLHS